MQEEYREQEAGRLVASNELLGITGDLGALIQSLESATPNDDDVVSEEVLGDVFGIVPSEEALNDVFGDDTEEAFNDDFEDDTKEALNDAFSKDTEEAINEVFGEDTEEALNEVFGFETLRDKESDKEYSKAEIPKNKNKFIGRGRNLKSGKRKPSDTNKNQSLEGVNSYKNKIPNLSRKGEANSKDKSETKKSMSEIVKKKSFGGNRRPSSSNKISSGVSRGSLENRGRFEKNLSRPVVSKVKKSNFGTLKNKNEFFGDKRIISSSDKNSSGIRKGSSNDRDSGKRKKAKSEILKNKNKSIGSERKPSSSNENSSDEGKGSSNNRNLRKKNLSKSGASEDKQAKSKIKKNKSKSIGGERKSSFTNKNLSDVEKGSTNNRSSGKKNHSESSASEKKQTKSKNLRNRNKSIGGKRNPSLFDENSSDVRLNNAGSRKMIHSKSATSGNKQAKPEIIKIKSKSIGGEKHSSSDNNSSKIRKSPSTNRDSRKKNQSKSGASKNKQAKSEIGKKKTKSIGGERNPSLSNKGTTGLGESPGGRKAISSGGRNTHKSLKSNKENNFTDKGRSSLKKKSSSSNVNNDRSNGEGEKENSTKLEEKLKSQKKTTK